MLHSWAIYQSINQSLSLSLSVLLELHEKINIPGFLTNAEAWTLSKKEEDDLEAIEIQALKAIFDLPIHTPTPAIICIFGLLFTRQRIDQKQLSFLHKVLNRQTTHCTRRTLEALEEKNIGWGKNIKNTLEKYNLPTDFQTVKNIPAQEWKRKTRISIEKENLVKIRQLCYKTTNDISKIKTKTKTVAEAIDAPDYQRKPQPEILNSTKLCKDCNTIDNEDHRISYCKKWDSINYTKRDDKKDFTMIYSHDITIIREILPVIEKIWNTKNAHGTMNLIWIVANYLYYTYVFVYLVHTWH